MGVSTTWNGLNQGRRSRPDFPTATLYTDATMPGI
jgi:hypothetical protein